MRKPSNGRAAQAFVDTSVIALAYTGAYFIRFDADISTTALRTLAWTLPYVVCLQYGLIVCLSVHRLAWRYVGLPDVVRIAKVVSLATAILVASRLVLVACYAHLAPLFGRALIPLGISVGYWFLALIGLVGVRVVRRVVSEREESVRSRTGDPEERVPTLLIGAGRTGVIVAKELTARADIGILPVGFLDDDPAKQGALVHGIPVVGTTADCARLCAARGAKQVLITMASASGKDIRRIAGVCEQHRIAVKIVPSMFDRVGGQLNLARIREIAIEDLLRREPVTLDGESICASLKGKVVLVTGAGGSIGSELCRQILGFQPNELVLVERSENNLFQIERELRASFPDASIQPCVADIGDRERMQQIFRDHSPEVVFHAAAHKHVPMMEVNPGEAIKNNILGTRAVAELADEFEVPQFVMISTDKAVNPSSVMGVSKRIAELIVQSLSQRSKTRFVAVRFGNVLGSAGSVVPIFQQQIARGGPVTVTHPDMKRYFMTIPEACGLVLQAGAMGCGGEIFVLDMGEQVKIVDLARDVIALSGLREGEDIEIKFTGIRPGEKLSEELSLEQERAERTRHPKIFIGHLKACAWNDVRRHVDELAKLTGCNDGELIRNALREFVPEFNPSSTQPPSEALSIRAPDAPPVSSRFEPLSTPSPT